MKKNYSTNLKRLLTSGLLRLGLNKVGKTLGFVLLLSLMAQLSFSQTSIYWEGTVDSDAGKSFNWNPQLTPIDNSINIDSAYKFTNLPVYNIDSSVNIYEILNGYTSIFTINVGKDAKVDVNGKNKHLSPHGKFIKGGEGMLTIRANAYVSKPVDTLLINNGTFEVRSALLMGNANVASTGGYIYVSGTGRLHCRSAPFRFTYPDTTMSVITITEEGTMTVVGDFTTIGDSLVNTTAQIKSTSDRDIVMNYDPLGNLTTFYSREKLAFLAEPGTTQNLTAGEDGEVVRIIENDGLLSMNSLVWKYKTLSGSFTDFPTTQTGDTIVPNFPNSGTFLVACIGNNGTTTDTTNEIKFIVASDKLHITPEELQILKLTQTPISLVVTEDEAVTSREWLYTTTPGEGHQSFDPKITDTVCTPIFKEVGEYFVICRSVISGNDHNSKEAPITFVDTNEYFNIRWNGMVSNDVSNRLNWSPHALITKTNITIDSSEYKNEPILKLAQNDTIGNLEILSGASFTVNIPEENVLYRGGDFNPGGDFNLQSGTFEVKNYFRFEKSTGHASIYGGVVKIGSSLLMSNSKFTSGGTLDIYGTGTVEAAAVDRFHTTDTTQSVITIWDEGKLIIPGNFSSTAADLMNKNQLKTLEGWDLIITVDKTGDSTTTISAFDPNAINVTPKATQILSIGELGAELAASNTGFHDKINGLYDSVVWKYSTTFNGDLIDIEPLVLDTAYSPSFSEPGEYYVVCVGMNDTLTKKSNKVKVIVPDVKITPSEKQTMDIDGESITLKVTESPTYSSRLWKYSTTAGGPYTETTGGISTETYKVLFPTSGTKYIVCESTFTEGNISKKVLSNEVEVEIVEFSIDPTTNQTIEVDEDGTMISAVESRVADSREWMVSSTAGSGYASFNPVQTGTTYTPNFATAGTYYVVCTSVFSGLEIESDEVQITVNSASGLNNHSRNSIALYPNPTSGTFVINEENISSYRVDVYNSTGKLVISEEFNNVSGPQELSLDTKGIYIVNLVSQNQVKTNTLIVE